jgi:hypothetical protein
MKILRLFLIASFSLSLLAGIMAGNFFFRRSNNSVQTSSTSTSTPDSPDVQHSIWLITVDRLNTTTPKVEGIWLLAYIPSYATMKLLPLLPSDNSQNDAELAKTFRFTKGRQLVPEFWNTIQKLGHSTRDYIIFDEVAVASIINSFGGVSIHGMHLSGLEAVTQIPKTWDDPQGSLQGQIVVMDNVCKNIFDNHTLPDIDILQNEVGKHIVSNLDLGKRLVEWQNSINSGQHKVCDFTDLYKKIFLSEKP